MEIIKLKKKIVFNYGTFLFKGTGDVISSGFQLKRGILES